ncbi:uncharacterized protein MELLADRAFT_69315 [Melampsora larici-populina 98AG31]|uniref:Uncharacterized protein n=1 Tax=Melampsora larici-populina (strain 98AG31 / pathotype 3-4-7) TaxID=747676 RepID=F4SA92_MELLP|nr:uncharacterized protein MELLADRAFT_69315 [Melampsora larici-populina 98AG31]EGF98444.1 hypothetical protein MELLADRAFT_69315 [Melampsora larici-populina 98AG31]
MAPRNSHYWKRGAPAKSIKALNSSVSDSLPKSNAAISTCIATFTRNLLCYNPVTKSYPLKPTSQELDQLQIVDQQKIFDDQGVFMADMIETGSVNLDRSIAVFAADLKTYGIYRPTFDWTAPDHSQWNRTMATFISKHWLYSYKQGLFNPKPVNPTHCTQANCMGLILRWVRGRTEEIRTGGRSHKKVLNKEKARKKRMMIRYPIHQLFQYRRESLCRLLGTDDSDDCKLMPDPDCCSETDWQPEDIQYKSIGLKWRSRQYTHILHQLDRLSFKYKESVSSTLLARRRFDQCRVEASEVNQQAPVCCGLPENCYEQVFLANLTPEARAALRIKPASNLLNELPSQIIISLQ